ncbi:MAG: drug resistance transporter, EmrB/QacA subfamily [Frankiales bacterium]|nr:drug resistance transporter, EmrB/QacA subfamily [Frankiales bacterium]
MTTPRADRHPFLVLAIVLTAVFVQLLDVSIVNVAIPSIQTDINASFAEVQLVLAGYQLAFACLLITGARLGDIFGRKKLFMIGMATFTVASTLCGLAPNATTLILARILQGIGSGLMFPQVLSVIQVTVPPKDRGKAFGIFGATIGIATILGPLVGGLLISLDLFGTDWRMIFLVNIPVGIVALVAAFFELPDSRSPDAPRLDLAGAALVTAGLFLLVYPLTEGREKGWPAWTYVMLAASIPCLVGFVLLQRRKTAADASPLLLMTLFGNRSFRAGLVLSMVFFAGIPAFFFTFSLYLQIGLGFSALHAGLTTFPFALASGLASSRSDGLAKRLGTNVLTLGAAVMTVGMLAIIVDVHLGGADITSYEIGPVLLIAGLGFGMFIGPLTNVVLAGIQGREAGSASGVLATVQQVGGALGLAFIGLVLFGILGGNATAAFQDERGPLTSSLTAAGLPSAAVAPAVEHFGDCFVRRAKSPDPSAVPAGCTLPAGAPPAVTRAFTRSADRARAENFVHAIERTLLFDVVIFFLAALLTRGLPKVDLKAAAHGPPAPAEA